MNTRIICGSTHGAWDEYGAHCSVCHLPDPRDAEIAALRARAEKAERRADDAKVYAQQMADRGTCGEIQAVGGARCGACRDCFAEQTARVEKIHHALLAAESRAEKAEAERDAAVEGKAEVFFAAEDRERLEAENATLREHVQVLRASAIGADGHCRLCTATAGAHRPWCAIALTEPK